MLSLQAVRAVEAVIAVDALKRKPREFRRQSFFGEYDLWLYIPVYDERLCPECLGHSRWKVFRGTELRSTFEYLEISDDDRIIVKVHPHCRCELYRIITPERYFRLLEELEEREKEEPQIDYSNSERNPKASINEMLNQLPYSDTRNLVIKVVSQSEISVGGYDVDKATITIDDYAFEVGKEVGQKILTHEIGHHVWHHLEDKQKDEWNSIWVEYKDQFKRDENESFAISYERHYVTHKYLPPKVSEYFKNEK
jgi:hypothetical protein